MISDQLDRLEKKLGYHFEDPNLLVQALSHRSVGNRHYERLEFLGDSILGFIIADEIYQKFPNATEGQMSRLRSTLVKGTTLAKLSQQLLVGDFLQLGAGELKSGVNRRESILADAFEAILGGIYLESGIEECRRCLIDWYGNLLSQADPNEVTKDPKTMLQLKQPKVKKFLPK